LTLVGGGDKNSRMDAHFHLVASRREGRTEAGTLKGAQSAHPFNCGYMYRQA
jgi:hypothetical protein